MKAARTGPGQYLVEFETEEELREEHRTSLSHGGLRLPAAERPALFSKVEVVLRGPLGAEVSVAGSGHGEHRFRAKVSMLCGAW
jgi:hypothetical protein